jgi:VanZ family protein
VASKYTTRWNRDAAFASPQTSRILLPLLHWLLPGLTPETLDLIHEVARKSGHFVNFFVLGLLLYRALRGGNQGWNRRWAILAALLAVAYAGTDEFHQSFEAGRGPSALDALLDAAGASAAQLVVWAYLRLRTQPAPAEPARE